MARLSLSPIDSDENTCWSLISWTISFIVMVIYFMQASLLLVVCFCQAYFQSCPLTLVNFLYRISSVFYTSDLSCSIYTSFKTKFKIHEELIFQLLILIYNDLNYSQREKEREGLTEKVALTHIHYHV